MAAAATEGARGELLMRRAPVTVAARTGRALARRHPPGTVAPALHRVVAARFHLPAALLHQLRQPGPLESPWVAAGFGTLLLASVALAIWRWLLRPDGPPPRYRRLRRGVLAVWLVSLAVLGGLAALNSYVGYIATLPALFGSLPAGPGGRAGGSRVVGLEVGAPSLDVPPSRLYVYLPPGYDTPADKGRRFPVVYLLHGYPGSPIDWFRGGRIQQTMDALLADGLVRPMIVAAPDASGGWMHDSEMLNQVGGPQVESYLVGPVVHAVDTRFRTIADRAGRAIGGVSSGGYGALNLGLRNQGVYSVVLSLMPYGDPGSVTATLLGGSRALWLANSPAAYIPRMTFQHRMAIDLIAGDRDPQRPETRRLAAMLQARGQPAVWTEVPGATHTWRGARLEAPYLLTFASEHLGRRPAVKPREHAGKSVDIQVEETRTGMHRDRLDWGRLARL
jgi:enterochelin esterase-like enzyme